MHSSSPIICATDISHGEKQQAFHNNKTFVINNLKRSTTSQLVLFTNFVYFQPVSGALPVIEKSYFVSNHVVNYIVRPDNNERHARAIFMLAETLISFMYGIFYGVGTVKK